MRPLLIPLAIAASALVADPAQAQGVVTEFPASAQPLATTALQERIAGRLFHVTTASGVTWRLQYQANGYFYINVSNGFSDTGKWRVESSMLCSEPQKSNASCNEMRLAGDQLYLKRDSGEIIRFDPR